MSSIPAWAASAAGKPFEPYEFEAGPLGPEEVEIAVEHCGLCHTDLTMLDNELGLSRYPTSAWSVRRKNHSGSKASTTSSGGVVGMISSTPTR